MERFKDYLDLKLSNESFFRQYYGQCSICPITVEIIKRIDESPETVAEIGLRCGVEEAVITNLREADDCCVDSVRKIAKYFNIETPEECLKDKVKK